MACRPRKSPAAQLRDEVRGQRASVARWAEAVADWESRSTRNGQIISNPILEEARSTLAGEQQFLAGLLARQGQEATS